MNALLDSIRIGRRHAVNWQVVPPVRVLEYPQPAEGFGKLRGGLQYGFPREKYLEVCKALDVTPHPYKHPPPSQETLTKYARALERHGYKVTPPDQ